MNFGGDKLYSKCSIQLLRKSKYSTSLDFSNYKDYKDNTLHLDDLGSQCLHGKDVETKTFLCP
jgi:hypothetical protein